ncbi:VOC family protein [Ornithinibacillus sp. 4-3]|uniref:VOC family protein n=1 Tax=Ornithinibacillus sp. 4-3 TaxID=3231488 RepID=A0AB39HTB7_9BACI
MKKAAPFLMFQGNAEEAINFYVDKFKEAELKSMTYYQANGAGTEGEVASAVFAVKGQEFMSFDSPIKHQFDFTPSFSVFITCESEDEIDTLYAKLLEDGHPLMPIGAYGFSKKFGWVNDRFGVSWQLNLE